jgi:predicted phage terminase large subunit-like protein
MKQAKHDDRILVTRGSTYDNAANLSDTMFREIQKYEGTKIGQQEIHGEILSGDSAGFIKKSWLRLLPSSEPLPKLDYVFTSYDPAFTAKKENDPTGFVALGIFKDLDGEYSVILLDAWADHLAYPDLRNQVIRDAERKYGEGSNNSRRPKAAIIEAKGGGNALIPDLKSTRVKIISFNPGTQDKHERLHTVSYLFKDGRVYLPESVKHKGEPVGYLADFVEQLTNFPLVQHDDMVDAISQALLLFMRGDLLNGETASDDDEDEDYDEPRYYETPKSNPYMQ